MADIQFNKDSKSKAIIINKNFYANVGKINKKYFWLRQCHMTFFIMKILFFNNSEGFVCV